MGRTKGSKNRSAPICHPNRKHKGFGLCGPCYKKQWRGNNPEARREANKRYERKRRETASWRNGWLLKQYGITSDDYDTMLEKQHGVCAICGGTSNRRRLAVDHCHKTGRVRGLLCERCNGQLGWLENENWVSAARSYIAQN